MIAELWWSRLRRSTATVTPGRTGRAGVGGAGIRL